MKLVRRLSIALLLGLAPVAASSQEVTSLRPPTFVSTEYFLRKYITEKVQPEYPLEARDAGIQGLVLVFVAFDKDGKVEDVRPLVSPHELLSEATVKAVKLWRMRAPLSKYAPDAIMWSELRFVFSLQDGTPEVLNASADEQKKATKEYDAERFRRHKLRRPQ